MKAITVKQPWAWAIIYADKDIENRSWRTNLRDTIAIHAGYNIDDAAVLPRGVKLPPESDLVRGAIIGVVDLVGVVEHSRSKWFSGPFGFVLANARARDRPVPCKGRLTLWDIPATVLRSLRKQLPLD
jgi:hypothetical protein